MFKSRSDSKFDSKRNNDLSFLLNGSLICVPASGISPETSLNAYLRTQLNQNATKFMCLEGGCGVCMVSINRVHPITKTKETMSMNSCLLPVLSCDGLEITTIEGLNNDSGQPNIISRRLAENHGSQCGYCSPAIVMQMFSLMHQEKGQLTKEEVERSLGGNICRCTGYRPILDTLKTFADSKSVNHPDLVDIEELTKCANKNNCKDCKLAPFDNKYFTDHKSSEWHKATKLEDIFHIFDQIESKKYMLVAGNTARGVYRRPDNIQVFIDVNNVAELKIIKERDHLELGGNVTLTQFKNVAEKLGGETNNFVYLREFAKHLDEVASLSIRNMGTIAGNLMIKYTYPEFVSDIFLLLDVINAQMELAQSDWKHKLVDMRTFLQTDMDKRVISKIYLPSLDNRHFVLRTYKIMNRTQNGSTYVSGGFLYEFHKTDHDEIVINSARIVFSGISPKFYNAAQTESYLVNKNIFNESVLQQALQILESELNPDWRPPAANPEARRKMAIGLFYRSVLSIASKGWEVSNQYRSGSEMLERPLSSGIQKFAKPTQLTPLGQPVTKLDALLQTTGVAEYCNDIPHMPDDLWATFVLATEVGSTILYIDAKKALAMKGVIAFYEAKDIPGNNSFISLKDSFVSEPEQLFVTGRVLYHNHPAGMIVATSFEIAQKAAELVKISYAQRSYRKPVLTIPQVMQQNDQRRIIYNSGQLREMTAPKRNETIIQGKLEMPLQYKFTLEPITALCIPVDDKIEIFPTVHIVDGVQVAIAELLNMPQNKIDITVRRVGGNFGFKLRRSFWATCACALACFKLRRRVRFVMTLEQMTGSLGKRNGSYCIYQVKVDNQGLIKHFNCDYYSDIGVHTNEHFLVKVDGAIKNIYQPDNYFIRTSLVRTDKPTNTFMRAPNDFDSVAISENIMEHIAHETKRDIHEVRQINMDPTIPMPVIYRDFLGSIKFYERKVKIDDFNEKNRWKKKGLALMPLKFSVLQLFERSALVSIFHGDGTVAISHGGNDMGHGLNTKAAQVAATVLGIPLNLVTVKQFSTLTDPNNKLSGGTITTTTVVYCVRRACEEINRRLQVLRTTTGITDWLLLVQRAFEVGVDLSERYFTQNSEVPNHFVYGVSCSEIELDVLTGRILIQRCDIVHDFGQSANPALDIGQVEGGYVMGMGYFTTEELIYSKENAELLTNRTWNYKPPLATDIPVDFRVSLLKNSFGPGQIFGMKGVGEPPVCLAPSVWFAIRYALNSARKDAGLNDNWYNIPVPCTPETLILLSGHDKRDMKL